MARPTQADFEVFTVRPKQSVRDNDPSSDTYGQRIISEVSDEAWEEAKASTQSLIDNYDADRKEQIRAERKNLLNISDWTVASDSPLSADDLASIKTWRQQLRDLPDSNADVDLITIPDCPVTSLNITAPDLPVEGTA